MIRQEDIASTDPSHAISAQCELQGQAAVRARRPVGWPLHRVQSPLRYATNIILNLLVRSGTRYNLVPTLGHFLLLQLLLLQEGLMTPMSCDFMIHGSYSYFVFQLDRIALYAMVFLLYTQHRFCEKSHQGRYNSLFT